MKLSLDVLILLRDLYKIVPSTTPYRMEVILEYAECVISSFPPPTGKSKYVIIKLHDEEGMVDEEMVLNLDTLRRLCQNIPVLEKATSGIEDRLYQLLLPSKNRCCYKHLNIITTYASILVYTEHGTVHSRSYHSVCGKCKKAHYHGYTLDKASGEVKFDSDSVTLIFNSDTAFSKKFIDYADNMICIAGVSFERTASVLNTTFKLNPPLNPDRLEAAWFVYRIIKFQQSIPWPRKLKSKELDLEKLCNDVYPYIKEIIEQQWVNHVCDEVGCAARFVVIDGNEKLFRSICAADKSKIITGPDDVNRYDICIRNPCRGNQHRKASKFCEEHSDGKVCETNVQIDYRPLTRSMSKTIPEVMTSGEGCKEEKNVNRFFNRTAGMFYIFRSCGVRVASFEMYTAESLSNVFTCLVDVFGLNPSTLKLNGVVYDRSCDLCPFILKLASNGNTIAKNYKDLQFIVDIFHAEKHTLPKCVLGSGSCEYHPHLDKFNHVRKMNTEIAEQSFKELNMYKCSTRKMTHAKRLLYLKFIDHSYNLKIVENRGQ